MRHPSIYRASVATLLIAGLGLAGCKKADDTPAVTTPTAATQAPSPAPPVAAPAPTVTVGEVNLGNAIGPDNRITMPSTSFARTDTIHASVATDGAGGNLTAKWTMGNAVVDTQDKSVPAGPQVTEFSISKPDGWPPGHYTLQLLVAGTPTQNREFDVK